MIALTPTNRPPRHSSQPQRNPPSFPVRPDNCRAPPPPVQLNYGCFGKRSLRREEGSVQSPRFLLLRNRFMDPMLQISWRAPHDCELLERLSWTSRVTRRCHTRHPAIRLHVAQNSRDVAL
jgi:hypothetical protein